MLDSASYNVKILKDGKIIAEKSVPVTSYNLRVRFDNVEAELWWPRGYGAQPLYDAEVSLLDKDGKELAKNIRKIGFRTVELEYADICPPDEKGKFLFKVNGIPIFIKGTNWVPVDALHGGGSEKLSSVLEMLADLNCNMVRIWGGGVYEPKEFFDYCDANGILVWHDFCMGCTFYPQRDDFAKTIENEAIQAVTRIRNHPSMALWCGNNENDISLRWQLGRYRINPNDDRISREVLPRVLLEFDPLRPYLPSSPFISQKYFDNPKNVIPSESHLWNSDGYYKIPFFSNTPAIFCSEIGYHGCPNLGSLKRMMTSGCVEPFIDDKAPGKVRKVKPVWTEDGYILFWTAPKAKTEMDRAVQYVVYRFDRKEKVNLNDPSHIVAVTRDTYYKLPYEDGRTKYRYVVTALDRLHNESKSVSKKVKL